MKNLKLKKLLSLFLSVILMLSFLCGFELNSYAAEEFDYQNALTSNFSSEVTPYNGLGTSYQGVYFGDYQMCGVSYTTSMYFRSYNNVGTQVDANLQDCFEEMTFYPGYISGDSTRAVTITILGDGQTLYSITLDNTDIPSKKTVNLEGVNRLTITTTGTYNESKYGLGALNLVKQTGKTLYKGPITSNLHGHCDPYYGMVSQYQGVYWDDFEMCGVEFKDGLSMNTYNGVDVGFGLNLGGKYSKISFYIGCIEGPNDCDVTITKDDATVYQKALCHDELYEYVELDVTGATKLEFSENVHGTNNGPKYGVGGITLVCANHNYVSEVTEPTCISQGYTTYTCTNCGDSYIDNYVGLANHNYVNGVCTVCGAVDPSYNGYSTTTTSTTSQETTTQPTTESTTQLVAPIAGATLDSDGNWVSSKVKKPTIKKVKAAKKSLTATWKKAKGVKGYQVIVATNKKFTKNKKKTLVKKQKTTKKTIKGLKSGKKYFVRVRTYKISKNVKVYSKWSKTKTVKVK